MVKDIGLITRTFPGRCIDYFIWVQRLQQELQYKMFAVPGATFEVGQWVQCTITEGACGYFKIETIRRTKKTHAAAALHVDRVLTIPSAKEDPLVAQDCQAQNEEIDGAFEHLSLTPEPPTKTLASPLPLLIHHIKMLPPRIKRPRKFSSKKKTIAQMKTF